MANRTASLAQTNVADVNFRAWINEVHNALIAFGWTQTADTGQINFSTVTRPVAINTYAGYALYAMADTPQSTCAVFIRLDFGTGGFTDGPGMKVQAAIGGTSGAGALTGNVSTVQSIAFGGVGLATVDNLRTAGTAGSFRFFWGMGSDLMWGFAIERDQATDGTDATTGLNVLCLLTRTTVSSQFLELAGGTGPVESKWYSLISAQASQSGGGNVGVGPVRCTLGPFRNPMKTIVLFAKADFVLNSTNPISIYGTSHTYLMLACVTTGQALNGLNTSCGTAIMFE